jgi:hypothetical protein
MKRTRWFLAAVVMTMGMTTISLAVGAPPASAGTQQVRVSVGNWRCPYGHTAYIKAVTVMPAPGYNFQDVTWQGRTTQASLYVNVPNSGAKAQVVAAYECYSSWWQRSTPVPAYGERWIYGTGWQPSWTV